MAKAAASMAKWRRQRAEKQAESGIGVAKISISGEINQSSGISNKAMKSMKMAAKAIVA